MVSEEKKAFVQRLAQLIREYSLIGIINLQNLPAQQLQKMRVLLLKNEIKIIMARKKVIELALDEANTENILQLKEKIKGMPALLFSKSNPFALYKIIQKNKSEAPAKAGQIAPKDIIVKAGSTNFAPGPIISELAAVGIKTKVDAGKLAIINDVTVTKEGEAISAKVAETLKRLDIKPVEVGLSLVAVWENGLIFEAKQLHLDEAEYFRQLITAEQWALNLATEAAYTSPDTIVLLLQKAFKEAKVISLEQNIITDLTAGEIISKVEKQANSLMEITMEITAPRLPTKHNTKQDRRQNRENNLETNDQIEDFNQQEKETLKIKEELVESSPAAGVEPEAITGGSREHLGQNYQKEPMILEDHSHNPESIKNQEFESKKPDQEKKVISTMAAAENDSSSAKELIKKMMAKNFDKDNKTILAERVASRAISAEKLVEEELNLAEQERLQQTAKIKKNTSVKQVEELYQKLKKTGTLRE